MKKSILTIALLFSVFGQVLAHYLWLETNSRGVVGQEQEIRVYFGEYTYGVTEKVQGKAYPKVKDFTLWVVDAKGNKTKLVAKPKENYYLATFTPKAEGTYTVLLNNNNIDVIDYTQYNFGIFKTHYHAVAKIQVGNKVAPTVADNLNGITIKTISKSAGKVKLQVLYKGKSLPENEVKVYVADQWSKTLKTDKNGFVAFKLPWETKYVIETTKKEEAPGTYRGKPYQFVWHCVTKYLTN